MNKIKKFFNNKENIKNIIIYFSLFTISLISVSTLFLDGFPMCDDSRFHLANILDKYKSIKSGNFSPISSTLGNGVGIGKELFYSPLSHITVVGFMLLGFKILFSFKLTIFLSIFLSGVFTYRLAYKISKKDVLTAIFIATIYILYPYRILDFMWRNAFAEGFAMMFLPLFFLGIYNVLKDKDIKIKSYVELILGAVGLFLSHNLTALYSYIFAIIFILAHFKDVKRLLKNKKSYIHIGISLFLIVGLCAINLFTQLELLNMEYYNISNPARMNQTIDKIHTHVNYAKFFSGFYGLIYQYGSFSPSYLTFELIIFVFISLSFICLSELIKPKLKKFNLLVSLPIYILITFAFINRLEAILGIITVCGLYTLYNYYNSLKTSENEESSKDYTLIIVSSLLLILLIIMIYTKGIWNILPKVLLNIQFPWRLFALVQIFICILIPSLFKLVKNKKVFYFPLIIVCGVLIISNETTLKRRNTYNELEIKENSDKWHFDVNEDLNSHAFSIGSCAEYCPEYYYYGWRTENLEYSTYSNSLRPLIEKELFFELGKNDHKYNPVILKGQGTIEVISKKAPVFEMNITLTEDSIIQMPLLYYPGYKAVLIDEYNDSKTKIEAFAVDGLVSFEVKAGTYKMTTKFTGSTTRNIGKAYFYVSLVGITAYIGYGIYKYCKSKKEELESNI